MYYIERRTGLRGEDSTRGRVFFSLSFLLFFNNKVNLEGAQACKITFLFLPKVEIEIENRK